MKNVLNSWYPRVVAGTCQWGARKGVCLCTHRKWNFGDWMSFGKVLHLKFFKVLRGVGWGSEGGLGCIQGVFVFALNAKFWRMNELWVLAKL